MQKAVHSFNEKMTTYFRACPKKPSKEYVALEIVEAKAREQGKFWGHKIPDFDASFKDIERMGESINIVITERTQRAKKERSVQNEELPHLVSKIWRMCSMRQI